jgi:hypothetical protein
MTITPVSSARTITIKQVFEQHLQLGQTPPAALEATIAWLKSCGDVEGLPRDWKLDLQDSKLVLLADGGTLDPAQVHLPDDWEEAAIGGVPLSDWRPAAGHPSIDWLAALLKVDPAMKRTKYRATCKELFGISGQQFDHWVLPEARVLAGLPRIARGGRPKKPSKAP